MNYSFQERWLLQAGVSKEKLPARLEIARKRAKRYPRPFCWMYPFLLWKVDCIGPLFLMGKLKLARNLTDDDFDEYIVRLKESRWDIIKLAGTLSIAPLMEVITDELVPVQPKEHPLEKVIASQGAKPNDYDVIIIGSGMAGLSCGANLSAAGLS